MSELEVRIVKQAPMRVLSSYGFGKEPEGKAWEKMSAYCHKHSLVKDGRIPPTYGFNNPNPSPGTPNYGYEIWLPVGEDVLPEGDMRIVNFSGGLYAVTRFKGLENIGSVWQQLSQWREGSQYKHATHQWLEHLLTPESTPVEEYVFDLFLPIRE